MTQPTRPSTTSSNYYKSRADKKEPIKRYPPSDYLFRADLREYLSFVFMSALKLTALLVLIALSMGLTYF